MEALLRRACECATGKGFALLKAEKTTAGRLVSQGYAYTLGFGTFRILVATKEGREALSKEPS